MQGRGQRRLDGFFWMGPAGTITPFHHDLTNNFMAQVIGRRRVKLVPSWDIPLMSNHLHCYSKRDGRLMPPTPNAMFDEPQVHECVLERGEILFLPIGCMHFVEGIDISVTVSFINFVFDNDFSSNYTTYHAVLNGPPAERVDVEKKEYACHSTWSIASRKGCGVREIGPGRRAAYSGLLMGCSRVCLVLALATSVQKPLNFEIIAVCSPGGRPFIAGGAALDSVTCSNLRMYGPGGRPSIGGRQIERSPPPGLQNS